MRCYTSRVNLPAREKIPGNDHEKTNHKKQTKNSVVKFDEKIVVHHMCTYMYAYRQARNGMCYVQDAADRLRFKSKIEKISAIVTPVLLKKIKEIYKDCKKTNKKNEAYSCFY